MLNMPSCLRILRKKGLIDTGIRIGTLENSENMKKGRIFAKEKETAVWEAVPLYLFTRTVSRSRMRSIRVRRASR